MQQSLARAPARCDAEIVERNDPSDRPLRPTTEHRSHGAVFVDYPDLEERHTPSDSAPAHPDQPEVPTQAGSSEGASSPRAAASASTDQLQEAWAVLLAADDELERDLECPIRRARGIVIGMVVGVVMWALLLGAGALVIYG